MEHRRKISWTGVVLIVVGSAILLSQLDMINLQWQVILFSLLSVAGALRLAAAFPEKRSGGVFFGALMFFAGLLGILFHLDFIASNPRVVIPSISVVIGLSILFAYSVRLARLYILVLALFFLTLGSGFLLAELAYLDRWAVRDAVRDYWPVFLIALGASMLLPKRKSTT